MASTVEGVLHKHRSVELNEVCSILQQSFADLKPLAPVLWNVLNEWRENLSEALFFVFLYKMNLGSVCLCKEGVA